MGRIFRIRIRPLMTKTLSERQHLAYQDFKKRAAQRAQSELAAEAEFKERSAALEKEHQDSLARIDLFHVETLDHANREAELNLERLTTQSESAIRQAQQDQQKAKQRAITTYVESKARAETDYKEARWTINTVNEADKRVAREQLNQVQRHTKSQLEEIARTKRQGEERLEKWNLTDDMPLFLNRQAGQAAGEPAKLLQQSLDRSRLALEQLRTMRSPGWLLGMRPWLVISLLWVAASAPGFLLELDDWVFWLIGSTAVVWPLGVALRWWLTRRMRRRIAYLWQTINQSLLDGKTLRRRCLIQARDRYKEQRRESKRRNLTALQQANQKARSKIKSARVNRDELMNQAQATYQPLLANLEKKQKADLAAVESHLRQRLAEAEIRKANALTQEIDRQKKARDDNFRRHASDWTRLVADWKQALERFRHEMQSLTADCRESFPAYGGNGAPWQPPATVPQGLLLGELTLNLENIPGAIPDDPHLPRADLNGIYFPALLSFPEKASIAFLAQDQGKQPALEAIQGILLRAWTALPPGKLKCTILDPVGRGENFGTFMHLADHDESLVNSRIWTESAHIEQRLADLTAHMETVLQKFLRNQFSTLAEYNQQAEEVAEPFRIVVAADFPISYTPDACRRLISLAGAGPRCGIYVFVLADLKQPLPQGIDLDDLTRACDVFTWQTDHFVWEDEDFNIFPLRLERLPPADICTKMLSDVGARAKIASRVEVPFSRIAPPPPQWWTGSTSRNIQVPLGRSGATGRQLLSLGQGTAQHVLVAGKTGSGKSTLLHVLITQLALHYSPDEVELYLVDFKKGVEFKTYAVHQLPHARVVAVESEREFGLSVLQRLDAELVRRGELFRSLGVNDLPSYRGLKPPADSANHPILPRLMLIVDEFQEFFVEDDKIAQEATLLLDRLVRQGRAFGIHVFLGSQTLGGAYSLARSTIDQMAVRIALQCSEADAHLILSKDNSDARLLSRPGEAIYNSANGLLEGNNLFQVVWLGDDQRDEYLGKIRAHAEARRWRADQPQIVFEGNAPSELTKNQLLGKVLASPPTPRSTWSAWLGEAVAIKDPTAAVFRKQSGGNLLIVGQNDRAAFAMMAAATIALAAQLRGQPATTLGHSHLVCAVSLEGEEANFLARLPELIPLQVHAPRELPKVLTGFHEEVERRMQGADGPPMFLFLHGLQRMRDLRRPEDDFGFSRKGEEKLSPFKQFLHLLKEGPPLGLFTILWADNLGNLQRSLDRQALREFEMRVLFQMSAADSSTLTDNPAAAKLGPNRALFYTEEQGHLEKFRPYGLPSLEWVQSCK